MSEPRDDHTCTVGRYLTGAESFEAGQWFIECPTCGRLARLKDYEDDARAIADRHAEIGGFERRS